MRKILIVVMLCLFYVPVMAQEIKATFHVTPALRDRVNGNVYDRIELYMPTKIRDAFPVYGELVHQSSDVLNYPVHGSCRKSVLVSGRQGYLCSVSSTFYELIMQPRKEVNNPIWGGLINSPSGNFDPVERGLLLDPSKDIELVE